MEWSKTYYKYIHGNELIPLRVELSNDYKTLHITKKETEIIELKNSVKSHMNIIKQYAEKVNYLCGTDCVDKLSNVIQKISGNIPFYLSNDSNDSIELSKIDLSKLNIL